MATEHPPTSTASHLHRGGRLELANWRPQQTVRYHPREVLIRQTANCDTTMRTLIHHFWRFSVARALALGLVFLPAFVWMGMRMTYAVSLEIQPWKDKVVVVTHKMDEFSSDVSHIRVRDMESKEVVWEAISREDDGTSTLGRFILGSECSDQPDGTHEGFRTIFPTDGTRICLIPDRRYRVSVWGESSMIQSYVEFVLPERRATHR